MKKLAAASVVTGAVWVALQFHESKPIDDPVDSFEVLLISSTFTLAAAVMVLGTPKWSARALGLFFTSIGTGVLFGVSAWVRFTSHKVPVPLPDGDVRYIPSKTPNEHLLDLGRACYLIGGLLLLYGIATWVRGKWFPHRHPYDPTMEIA